MDILSGAGALLGRNKQLAPGLIETTRLKDANQQEPSKSVVQSVEFHPAGQLLLTAGLDKRLRLFQVLGQLQNEMCSISEQSVSPPLLEPECIWSAWCWREPGEGARGRRVLLLNSACCAMVRRGLLSMLRCTILAAFVVDWLQLHVLW